VLRVILTVSVFVGVALIFAGYVAHDGVPLTAVSYTSVASGDVSGIGLQRFEVINDPATFRGLWTSLVTASGAMPHMPEVDFSHETVIALFLGRHHGGYSFEVSGIRDNGQTSEVDLKVRRPRAGCPDRGPRITPFQIVRTRKLNHLVSFRLHIRPFSC